MSYMTDWVALCTAGLLLTAIELYRVPQKYLAVFLHEDIVDISRMMMVNLTELLETQRIQGGL